MINLQNGAQPVATNAIEIDAVALDLQTRLDASLAWLTHGHGKVYRNIDSNRGLNAYYPEVFMGGFNYMRVTPDNDKTGQSVILVGNEIIEDFEPGISGFLRYDLSILFTANLKLVNATLLQTEYYQQNLIREARNVITNGLLGANYRLELNDIEKEFNEVWRDFDIEEQRGIAHSPLTHFRFNCTVYLKEDCLGVPFDRCATILSMTTQAEQDCISSALGGNCDYNDCSSLLANLTTNTKNTCILPTYDFTDLVVQSNVTVQQQTDLSDWLCTPCDYNDCAALLAGMTDATKNTCILPTYDFTTNNVKTNLTQQQIDDLIQWLCIGVNAGTAGSGDFFKIGNKFYGSRSNGGANNVGAIYNTDFGVSATILYDFSTATMNTPINLCFAENNIVYGIASLGGNNGAGGVFSYNTSTNVLTEIAHFDNATTGQTSVFGNQGYGKAVKQGGYLYVVTMVGSTNNEGAILAIDVVNSSPIIVYPFGAGITNTGLQTFVEASDGFVYEFTNRELRKIDSATNTSSLAATTIAINTGLEFGQPLVELNGYLYWTIRTTKRGGANYSIYQYDLATGTAIELYYSTVEISLDLFVWNSNLYLLTTAGIYLVNIAAQNVSSYIAINTVIRGQASIDGNLIYYRDVVTDDYYIFDMQAQTVTSKSLNFI